jgi:hypothetical protein
MGQQLLGDEAAYGIHQHFLFLGQLEIHGLFLGNRGRGSLPMKRGARFSWRRARLGAVFAAPAEQAGGQFR